MQVERYRIILTGWVVSGRQTRDVVAELSRLFKIPEDQVRPLLAGEPSIIRRDLTLEKAERLRNKIEQRGAVCSIKLFMREEHEDRGFSIDGTGILEPDLNMESTQFVPLTAGATPSVKRGMERAGEKTPAPVATTVVTRRSKGAGVKQRKGRKVATWLLLVAMVAALVLGYLYLYPDLTPSHHSPDIFTLSPAKGSVDR